MIDYVVSWQKRLRGRLYWQFKNVADWQAIADMIAVQAQDMEDAAQAVLTITSIDDSVGPQLDVIGRVVKQDRLGAADAVYRMYLKAKVQVNRSSGTIEDLYLVFNALFGALGYEARTHPVKTFVFNIGTAITAAQASIAKIFLRNAKEAGARGILQFHSVPPGQLFTFDVGPGFDVGKLGDAAQV